MSEITTVQSDVSTQVEPAVIDYTNYRGERSLRRITPISVAWPTPNYMLSLSLRLQSWPKGRGAVGTTSATLSKAPCKIPANTLALSGTPPRSANRKRRCVPDPSEKGRPTMPEQAAWFQRRRRTARGLRERIERVSKRKRTGLTADIRDIYAELKASASTQDRQGRRAPQEARTRRTARARRLARDLRSGTRGVAAMSNQYSRDPDTFWTAEREDELIQLHAEGLSYSQIADKLGCTKNSVTGKANRMGLRRRDAYPRLTARRAREAAWDRAQAAAKGDGPLAIPTRFKGQQAHWIRVRTPTPLPVCEPIEGGIRFGDIRPGQCRFIPGEPSGLDTTMCGQRALVGTPYCAGHAAIAYIPPEQRKRRAA
jgi:GcrA cell cycle regulator